MVRQPMRHSSWRRRLGQKGLPLAWVDSHPDGTLLGDISEGKFEWAFKSRLLVKVALHKVAGPYQLGR